MTLQIGFVGAGKRLNYHMRALRETGLFEPVAAMSRGSEASQARAAEWSIPLVPDLDALLALKPAALVVSLPHAANGQMLLDLKDVDLPILVETPPAWSPEEMFNVWEACKDKSITVGEQYLHRPYFALVKAIVAAGLIGDVHYCYCSVAHGYHGVSIPRALLGVGMVVPMITARRHAEGIDACGKRDGQAQLLGIFQWPGKTAVLDFIGSQYTSPIRPLHFTLRGRRGEIHDDVVRLLDDEDRGVEMSMRRDLAGGNGSLDGFFLKGMDLGTLARWENPFGAARLSDEEISVAALYAGLRETVENGTAPAYSLADGLEDHRLAQAWESAAQSGETVTLPHVPWQPPAAM